MAQYCNITADEMQGFLGPQGFWEFGKAGVPALKGVRERTWGKIVERGETRISIRVFTGIDPCGSSRAVGKDAIRVALFWKDATGKVSMVGGSKRVHRVRGWKKNLQSRLDAWLANLGPTCKCGSPMRLLKVKRPGPNKGREFYGCCIRECNGFQWKEDLKAG